MHTKSYTGPRLMGFYAPHDRDYEGRLILGKVSAARNSLKGGADAGHLVYAAFAIGPIWPRKLVARRTCVMRIFFISQLNL
jgi:hypothetical protein